MAITRGQISKQVEGKLRIDESKLAVDAAKAVANKELEEKGLKLNKKLVV